MYACGKNLDGELGLGGTYRNTFTALPNIPLRGRKLICAGDNFTIIYADRRNVQVGTALQALMNSAPPEVIENDILTCLLTKEDMTAAAAAVAAAVAAAAAAMKDNQDGNGASDLKRLRVGGLHGGLREDSFYFYGSIPWPYTPGLKPEGPSYGDFLGG